MNQWLKFDCFVTIRIFARTEPMNSYTEYSPSFVTIRIFARTEPATLFLIFDCSFVTIRIFARTERFRKKLYTG